MIKKLNVAFVAALLSVASVAVADEPAPVGDPGSIEAQLAELKVELARQRVLLEARPAPKTDQPPPDSLPPLPIDPPHPNLHVMQDVSEIPIDRMLSSEVSWTGLGSFKFNIPRTGISPYVHGLARVGGIYDSQPDPAGLALHEVVGSPFTFDATEIDAFIGAEFRDLAFVEFMLGIEHGSQFALEFGQIDLRIYRDYLFLRAGKFRVPVGGLNVYPDPLFHLKLPELPLFARHILPEFWSEVGAQLMGTYSWGDGRSLRYSLYAVNALLQPANPTLPGVSEGGQVSDFVSNEIAVNGRIGFGGRLSLEAVKGLTFGASAYTGSYTADDKRRLTITDVDAGFHRGRLTLRAEVALTLQEITDGTLIKHGGYAMAAFRALSHLEPVVQVEWMRLDGTPTFDRFAPSAGVIVYPYPRRAPTIQLKTSYTPSWDGAWQFAGHRLVVQVAAGF